MQTARCILKIPSSIPAHPHAVSAAKEEDRKNGIRAYVFLQERQAREQVICRSPDFDDLKGTDTQAEI
jgi:hypothetical protein